MGQVDDGATGTYFVIRSCGYLISFDTHTETFINFKYNIFKFTSPKMEPGTYGFSAPRNIINYYLGTYLNFINYH